MADYAWWPHMNSYSAMSWVMRSVPFAVIAWSRRPQNSAAQINQMSESKMCCFLFFVYYSDLENI
jgi:hypothetical protein